MKRNLVKTAIWAIFVTFAAYELEIELDNKLLVLIVLAGFVDDIIDIFDRRFFTEEQQL